VGQAQDGRCRLSGQDAPRMVSAIHLLVNHLLTCQPYPAASLFRRRHENGTFRAGAHARARLPAVGCGRPHGGLGGPALVVRRARDIVITDHVGCEPHPWCRGCTASAQPQGIKEWQVRLTALAGRSGVLVLALARGMLDGENDDFLVCQIDGVVDQIGVAARNKLTHALQFLPPSDLRKQDQVLQGIEDRCPHAQAAAGFRSRI